MNITIVGSGYVGLVTGACLAELGNSVFCLDVDADKVSMLNSGGVPIYEPGLKEMIQRNRCAGRLTFSIDAAAGVNHAAVQFIAVGTPPGEDGSADLKYVLEAARNIGRHMTGFKVVVDKSTVPVGTSDAVAAVIREELAARGLEDLQFSVISNPEFLKEGVAVEDFMRPDRIVLGCNDDVAGRHARAVMRQLYAPFNRNHERTFYMDVRSAELTKYAANCMLATRISFMNELANLAEELGADIELVRLGMGSDPRIGYSFLYAGTGYGGSCFPKDVKALMHSAAQNGRSMQVLGAVLAYELIACGASVRVYDPVAMEEARQVLQEDLAGVPDGMARITFCEAQMDALDGADALVIVTEWKVFNSPDFVKIRGMLKYPIIFDGRNIYDPHAMADVGIEYHGIGRSSASLQGTPNE